MIAAAAMGDPNASIPTPQPVHYRPMFGAFGKALGDVGDVRVAGGARRTGSVAQARPREAARRGRGHAAARQEGHDAQRRAAAIDVDPETYEVRADGELLTCEPATVLPMAQRYFLF